jgi:hypothetical protein
VCDFLSRSAAHKAAALRLAPKPGTSHQFDGCDY